MTSATSTLTGERADLLEALAAHRYFLRFTVQGLTDEQARQRTTASELTLGGLVKHVASVERHWIGIVLQRPDDAGPEDYEANFRLGPDETLAGVLAAYDGVAAETERVVASIADLGQAVPVPNGVPWFPPGARRSARRVFLHIIAETAQHSGHADILRESLDGQKTMG